MVPRAISPLSALCLLLLALLPPPARAGEAFPVPGPGDRCPICGMPVARYPEWAAGVSYPGGPVLFFDGAMDLFRHLLSPEGQRRGIPVRAWVTSYYSARPLDAFAAWYVTGSDVLGPMGNELIPLAGEEEAREFARDHKGKRILRAGEVTSALLEELD